MSKFDVDAARGFDVLSKAGKVVEHFDTYEQAVAYAARRRQTVRYWAKGAPQNEGEGE